MDLETGYRTALDGVVYFELGRELVRCDGPDVADFLQGMVTQDVKRLPPHGVAYTTVLTQKGALVSDARVARLPDGYLLMTERALATPLAAALNRYIVSEDAEVRAEPDAWCVLDLLGPSTSRALTALALPSPEADRLAPGKLEPELGPVFVLPGWLPKLEGAQLVVSSERASELRSRLEGASVQRCGEEVFDLLRVERGVPRFGKGRDLDESIIPLQADLQHAISYDKGCYVGQEVIARATYRGHMNRKLVGLVLGEHVAAPGTPLCTAQKRVGWLSSVVRSPRLGQVLALGYVNKEFVEPGTRLEVGEDGAGVATVRALPFV